MNEQMRRYLELNGAKLPPKPPREGKTESNRRGEGRESFSGGRSRKGLERKSSLERRAPLQRGRRPRQESENQAVRRKRWSFIRACFLICQKRTDGYYSCQECGLKTNNAKHLDLDHIERRLPTNYVPQNAMLLCNRLSENGENSCHVRKTGTLQWSQGQEEAS